MNSAHIVFILIQQISALPVNMIRILVPKKFRSRTDIPKMVAGISSDSCSESQQISMEFPFSSKHSQEMNLTKNPSEPSFVHSLKTFKRMKRSITWRILNFIHLKLSNCWENILSG